MLGCVEEMIQLPGSPNLYWALTPLPRPFVALGPSLELEQRFLEMTVPGLDHLERLKTDEQWAQQKNLQKGLALSSLGNVNIEKKDNAQAVENLKAAAPLLKPDDGSYGRNQYRLGYALLNLKKTAEAKEAFTQAASVNSPYKTLAQEKLKASVAPARRKAP